VDTSAVIIEEITGPYNRQVVLSGAALPHKPAEWHSRQKVTTTWYPGNNRASQQVIGPQDPPSKWNGKWSLVQLSRTPVLLIDQSGNRTFTQHPMDIMTFVEDIQRQGALLRVSWSTADGVVAQNITREGRLEDIAWKVQTAYDVEWEFDFTWTGRLGSDGQRVTATRLDNTADAIALQVSMNNFITGIGNLGLGIGQEPSSSYYALGQFETLSTDPIDLLIDFTDLVQDNLGDLTTLGNVYVTQGNQTFATSNTYTDFAATTAQDSYATMDALSAIPSELLSKNQDVGSLLDAVVTFGEAWSLIEQLSDDSTTLVLNARTNMSYNPGGAVPTNTYSPGSPVRGIGLLATYETRKNDTPITVSMRFYNSPDYVMYLLEYNHLPWYTVLFPPGQILMIPVQPVQPGGPG
jgi:hypothetical protein